MKNGNKIYCFRFDNNVGVNIEFRCSYLLFNLSLKKLAESFNLNIKKGFIPYKFISKKTLNYIGKKPNKEYYNDNDWYEENRSEINIKLDTLAYCLNDLKILEECLMLFYKLIENEFGMDFFSKNIYTISSLSLNVFFTKFNLYNVKLLKNMPENECFNFIKKSIHGGRCEVFGNALDWEKIYYFDFNQMYPNVMKKKYPIINNYLFKKKNNPKDIKFGIYEIIYDSYMDIPILPQFIDNRLKFVNGRNLCGIFFSEEILLFKKNGGLIKKINWGIEFENNEKIFEDFMNNLINKRLLAKIAGDYAMSTIYKLMANSFYGRFNLGQSNLFYNLINTYKKNCPKINNYYLEDVGKDSIKACPLWASITTSYARIILYEAYLEVKRNGGRILYSDTDSIFAAFKIEQKDDNYSIIKWQKIYKKSIFCAPKVYSVVSFDNLEEVKFKGIKSNKIDFNILKENFLNDKSFDIDRQFALRREDFKLFLNENSKKISFIKEKRLWLDNKKIFTKAIFVEDANINV